MRPPLVCYRHLPVRGHLLHQLHELTRRLLWLQLRVGLRRGRPPAPGVRGSPWRVPSSPGQGMEAPHLARECGPRPPSTPHVPAGRRQSGRQQCRASSSTCESGQLGSGRRPRSIQQDRNVKREPLHTIQVASTGSRHLPVCLGQDSTTEGLRGLGQVALPSEPQFLHLQSGLVVTALPHRVTVIRI